MSLPEQIVDSHTLVSTLLIDIAHGHDLGSATITINIQPGLKCILVNQANVSLVQYCVFGLKSKLSVRVGC